MFEPLTVTENLKMGAYTLDQFPEDEPLGYLERVGLADDAEQKAGGYSRGMTRQLGLAMALVWSIRICYSLMSRVQALKTSLTSTVAKCHDRTHKANL